MATSSRTKGVKGRAAQSSGARRRTKSPTAKSTGPAKAKQTSTPDADEKARKLALYNKVVDQADLSFVRLVEASFRTNAALLGDPDYRKKRKLSYKVTPAQVEFSPEGGEGGGYFECTVKSRMGRGSAVLCNAIFYVGYESLIGCDEEAVKAFISRIGRFTCYPYFRSLVATLDWNAYSILPPLPVLKSPIPGAGGTD